MEALKEFAYFLFFIAAGMFWLFVLAFLYNTFTGNGDCNERKNFHGTA